jgi:hypothetical protein
MLQDHHYHREYSQPLLPATVAIMPDEFTILTEQ